MAFDLNLKEGIEVGDRGYIGGASAMIRKQAERSSDVVEAAGHLPLPWAPTPGHVEHPSHYAILPKPYSYF